MHYNAVKMTQIFRSHKASYLIFSLFYKLCELYVKKLLTYRFVSCTQLQQKSLKNESETQKGGNCMLGENEGKVH